MPADLTREEIEHLLGQVRSAAYGGDAPYPVSTHRLIAILEHTLSEPTRLASAKAEPDTAHLGHTDLMVSPEAIDRVQSAEPSAPMAPKDE